MSFLKSFFSSCLGALVAFIVLIVAGIFIISSLSAERTEPIDETSILHLRLEAPITELELDDPLAEILPGAAEETLGLMQIKQAIRHAKTDPNIEGIYLNTSFLAAGVATIQELRESLFDFKESGKWIIAYADNYSEGAYYLATVADKIYFNPEGELEFNGLATEVMFFKKLFDKLEIKPEIFRVGDFKSAVEPFMREDLSDENKLQLNSLLGSIHETMLRDISEDRKVPYEKLKEIAGKMLVREPQQAVSLGLVDSLFYEDQVKDMLRSRLDLKPKNHLPLVKYTRYRKSFIPPASSKNEISVIVADGEILPGRADQGRVGSATIVEQVRRARMNDNVKAIVLRVNSPGGVFQAGDMMWREISLAAGEKPVIASMSDLAASGGYYIAMACDTIVAQPSTITGSIGVFAVLFDLSGFLGNKVGITSEEVKTGEIGELATVTRTLTDTEKAIWQKQTDKIYETFTRKAAEGRRMSQDDIKKIASGRVWSGAQAKDNGLADVLGGFDDAVKIAAEKAGVGTDYKLRFYPRPKALLDRLMGDVEESVRVRMMQREMGEFYGAYRQWENLKTYQGVQARMGTEFRVK